jgi:hypothetical protein
VARPKKIVKLELRPDEAAFLAILLCPNDPHMVDYIMNTGRRKYSLSRIKGYVSTNSYPLFNQITDAWAETTGRPWDKYDQKFLKGGDRG